MRAPFLAVFTAFLLTSLLILQPSAGQDVVGSDQDAFPHLTFDATPEGPVFVIPISGMIDNPLSRYVERALEDASARGAGLVIFDVDTFGGLLDAADQIRKALLDVDVPTVAFIDKNAASAGALISYAADRIVMVPGASIGAATVVEGVGGEAAPDKYQSYMRSLMRATAEANGRDPQIAEAMVDENLVVEGVSEAGQVLTLSTGEAIKWRVADAEMESIDQLLAFYRLESAERVEHQLSSTERLLRFFASPVVQSILMLMMLGGLYFELQSPGVGFPGMIALFGAAVFFGPHYLLGLVESWEILLFAVGIILLLIEIFVIPGFGIVGISGLAAVIVALGVSLIGNIGFSFPSGEDISSAILTMASTMVMLVILLASAGRWLPKSDRFGQLVLTPTLSRETGHTFADSHVEWIGRKGTALTALRPSGTAAIDNERIDVVTSGEYIEKGEAIEVVDVHGSRVRVRSVARLT